MSGGPATDLLPATKTCSKCGKLKPLSDGFYRHKDNRNQDSRDGFRSECKTCTLAKNAAWRAVHRPKRTLRVLAPGLLCGLVLPGEKACSCCGLPKDLATGFFRDKNRVDGHHSRCKDCQRLAFAAWAATNPEKNSTRKRTWNADWSAAQRELVFDY
jgi:hypothetical protein